LITSLVEKDNLKIPKNFNPECKNEIFAFVCRFFSIQLKILRRSRLNKVVQSCAILFTAFMSVRKTVPLKAWGNVSGSMSTILNHNKLLQQQ